VTVHIGCSGWHYLHWRGDFYPENTKTSEFLKLYLASFDTVEINNTFYRLPSEKAIHDWRNAVTPNFKFSVKASRFFTHNKKLKDSGSHFQIFFDRIMLLGTHLGPVLFQLPPKWNYNGNRFEEFLAILPQGIDYIFEFRNPDWMRDEAFQLLEKYNIGFCIHDMPESKTPEIVVGKVAYLRFHGPQGTYGNSYPKDILSSWAKKIRAWDKKGVRVYVYFNNDIGGFAPHNALTLMELVEKF
jgi:uncharacterized protein YecE (DUF72 family)